MNIVIKIVVFILLIISSFIYNEFVVINICGFSKNTKLFLDYEAKNETIIRKDTEMSEEILIEVADIFQNDK